MRARRLLGASAALVVLLAACGNDDDAETADTTTTVEETTTTAEEEPTTTAADGDGADGTAAGELNVQVEEDDELGEILVTRDGSTLYAFLPDDAGGAATCTGNCLDTWPPHPDDGDIGPHPLGRSQFGTTETEGVEQVTYMGWPLYTFSGDAAAGDTSGQGVGDQWYVMGPDGPIQDG